MSLSSFFNPKYDMFDDITSKHIKIDFLKVTFSPFSQLKCLNCGMYRRNWHCANNPRYDTAQKLLGKFKNHHLVYAQMDCSERREIHKKNFPKLVKVADMYAGKQVYAIIKKIVNDDIVFLHNQLLNSGKDHRVFGAGGGCTHCRDCAYLQEQRKKCQKPGISFPSIESWGVDVYKTLKNFGFKIEIPPKNVYTVVGYFCF